MAKQKVTSVQVLKKHLEQGGSVEQIAKSTFEELQKRGQKSNTAGKKITEPNLARLAKAMLRDIRNERQGWWSNYKVEEDKDAVKIVSKG